MAAQKEVINSPRRKQIFIRRSHIQLLHDCGYRQAGNIINQIRQAYDKATRAPVTLDEYAAYYSLDSTEIAKSLK